MSSRASVLIGPESELLSADDSSTEFEIDSSSTKFHFFSNKFPSSNCTKFMMSPFFLWDDASYGIYETNGCVATPSEYGCDVYDNALENVFSNTTQCEKTIFFVIGT